MASDVNRAGLAALDTPRAAASLEMTHGKVLPLLSFIAVFFSSVVGARVYGISINTLALLPLLAYMSIGVREWRIPTTSPLLWYYTACTFAGMVSLFRPAGAVVGYESSAIQFVSQMLLVCTPLYIVACETIGFSACVKRAFVLTCRIQVAWGLAQYILWTFGSFDLNQYVFVDCLGGLGKTSWTALSNLGNGNVLLRVSGLNSDGAFLGLLLVLGMILDKSTGFRCAYLSCLLICGQRSALVAFAVMGLAAIVLHKSKTATPYDGADFLRKLAVPLMVIALVGLVVVAFSPSVRSTVLMSASRFDFLSDGSVSAVDGTYRHIMYLPTTIEQLLAGPLDVTLFGVGPRASGLLLSDYDGALLASSYFGHTEAIWSIESDFAGVFAGAGLVGGCCYLAMYVWFWRKGDYQTKLLFTILFVYGFMYNFSLLMVTQLLYVAIACECRRENAYALDGKLKVVGSHLNDTLNTNDCSSMPAAVNPISGKRRQHDSG